CPLGWQSWWSLREADDSYSIDQKVLSYCRSWRRQVDVRRAGPSIFPHGRYIDHSSDHDCADDEAGRRGHVTFSYRYHAFAWTVVQVPYRGLSAEHHGQSNAATEVSGHQEGN